MNELQQALNKMIESGPQSNPALNTAIHDYAKYHEVLVIVVGALVAVFAWFSLFCWIRFNRKPKTSGSRWDFEKNTYFSFGILSGVMALLLALIVTANATNAFHPIHGFSLLAESFELSKGDPYRDHLSSVFMEWIKSGNENIPLVLQEKINDRIAFHSTKAIICGILLILFAALSVFLWKALIKRSRVRDAKWRFKEAATFISGIVSVAFTLLLMVFVVPNIQGAIAPMAAFLKGLLL